MGSLPGAASNLRRSLGAGASQEQSRGSRRRLEFHVRSSPAPSWLQGGVSLELPIRLVAKGSGMCCCKGIWEHKLFPLLLFPVTPAGSSHSNQALHLPHLHIQAPLLLRKSWYWNKTRFGSHQIVPGFVAVKPGHVELKHLVKGGLETKISKGFLVFFAQIQQNFAETEVKV